MNTIEVSIGAATARVVADSISPENHRMTTVQVRYPRIIHAEARTHRRHSLGSESLLIEDDLSILEDRRLSRNARSSRAVPVARLIGEVEDKPFVPVFAANQSGMQAGEQLGDQAQIRARAVWCEAAAEAARVARELIALGVHKQWANRVLEPFGFIDVVISATDWANFLALRCHPAAQPEMQDLAGCIKVLLESSKPKRLVPGAWHLPYVDQADELEPIRQYLIHNEVDLDVLTVMKRLSVVRCARVSYAPHTGERMSIGNDLRRYGELVNARPVHASPAEHQATPDRPALENLGCAVCGTPSELGWSNPKFHGNLTGWCQLRKFLCGERVDG